MKPIHTKFTAAFALTIAVAACVPAPRPAPPVQTRPITTPATAPAPPPAPAVSNWMDAPQTEGEWSYAEGNARFRSSGRHPIFEMNCDRASRDIVLTVESRGAAQMIVRTETQARALPTLPSFNAQPAISARLSANDRLLDAMALSKGRFAVEVIGTPTLYLPSWAEVTRVIEDCR